MPSGDSKPNTALEANAPRKSGKGKKGVSINEAKTTSTSTATTSTTTTGNGASSTLTKDHLSSVMPAVHEKRETLRKRLGERGVLVGIKNLGATCYINSLLQTIFMTPEIRRLIVAQLDFEPKQRHAKNIAYQLQLLFAKMQSPLRSFVDASALVKSFGMGEEAHREQHDVQELNRKLLDLLQEFVDRTKAPQIVREVYQGQYSDYVRCATCGHTRLSSVPYQDVSVAIDGKDSLEACLDAYIAPELIEGINCDQCQSPQPTHKGLCFSLKECPKVLSVQLRRLDFNLKTFRREKIHQDVKLPHVLDLASWATAEGRSGAPSEGADGASSSRSVVSSKYCLHAIIAHRGTAYHGHYYAYVRVRNASDGSPRWVKFDDDRVSYCPADEVLEYVDPAMWKAIRAETEAEDKKRKAEAAAGDVSDAANPLLAPMIAPSTSPTQLQVEQPPLGTIAMAAAVGTDNADIDNFFEGLGSALAVMEGGKDGGGGGVAASASSRRSGYVDGQSYYALYRRVDPSEGEEFASATTSALTNPLPATLSALSPAAASVIEKCTPLTGTPSLPANWPDAAAFVAFPPPASVSDACAEEDDALRADAAELALMSTIIPFGIIYRGKKHWIEAMPNWTVSTLLDEVDAQITKLKPLPVPLRDVMRLRHWDAVNLVMAESYSALDPDTTTVAEFNVKVNGGPAKVSSWTTYSVLAVEERTADLPDTLSQGGRLAPWKDCSASDLHFKILVHASSWPGVLKEGPSTAPFVDLPGHITFPFSCYADATMSELIAGLRSIVPVGERRNVHLVYKHRGTGNGESTFVKRHNLDPNTPGGTTTINVASPCGTITALAGMTPILDARPLSFVNLDTARVADVLGITSVDEPTLYCERIENAAVLFQTFTSSTSIDPFVTAAAIQQLLDQSPAVQYIAKWHLMKVKYTFTPDDARATQEAAADGAPSISSTVPSASDPAAAAAPATTATSGTAEQQEVETLFANILDSTEAYCSARNVSGTSDTWPEALIDGRKLMSEVKAEVCRLLGRNPSTSQMLVDGSRREPRTMNTCTLRTYAAGVRTLSIEIIDGAPLHPGQSYVDVFVSTENYDDVVKYATKVLVDNNTSTMENVLALSQDARPDLLPRDGFYRGRLMAVGRLSSLGVPVTKSLLKECVSSTHHMDDLRIVFQRVHSPNLVTPIPKSSLVLRAHRWNSQDPRGGLGALGPWVDFVCSKDSPMVAIFMALQEKFNIEQEDLFVALARPYQVRSQEQVAHLPWMEAKVICVDPNLSGRTIVGLLKAETDDLLLIRGRHDVWVLPPPTAVSSCNKLTAATAAADEEPLEFGVFGAPPPNKKRGRDGIKASAGKGSGKGSGGKSSSGDGDGKKKGANEATISLQFVWEDDEPPATAAAGAEATTTTSKGHPPEVSTSGGGSASPGPSAVTNSTDIDAGAIPRPRPRGRQGEDDDGAGGSTSAMAPSSRSGSSDDEATAAAGYKPLHSPTHMDASVERFLVADALRNNNSSGLDEGMDGGGNNSSERGPGGGANADHVNYIDFLPAEDYLPANFRGLPEDCKICFDRFSINQTVVLLSCHHIYHRECLEPWLAQSTQCPECHRNVLE